jgi:hypothetical protein
MNAIKIVASTYDEAVRKLPAHFKPGLFLLQVAHDDGCPAIASRRKTRIAARRANRTSGLSSRSGKRGRDD